jgi:hypothetical protein
MAKTPSPWESNGYQGKEEWQLKRVSIKQLYKQIAPSDLYELLERSEGLWNDTVALVEELNKLEAKTTDGKVKEYLKTIIPEIEKVQAFTFDLTEY